MNKPFTVVYEEFKQELTNLINTYTSCLPASIIETILQNYLNEVSSIAKKQYQFDKAKYENSLNDNEE